MNTSPRSRPCGLLGWVDNTMSDGCDPAKRPEPGTSAPTVRLATAPPTDASRFRRGGDKSGEDEQADDGGMDAAHVAEPRSRSESGSPRRNSRDDRTER